MAFDKLVREVDRLLECGAISEPVLCQIGKGTYEPKHCDYFRFRPSLEELFSKADLVVTHGGATVVGLLLMRKPFVAVPNGLAADQHQLHFLERLSRQTPIYWTADLSTLESLITTARLKPLDVDLMPSLAGDLNDYIQSQVKRSPRP